MNFFFKYSLGVRAHYLWHFKPVIGDSAVCCSLSSHIFVSYRLIRHRHRNHHRHHHHRYPPQQRHHIILYGGRDIEFKNVFLPVDCRSDLSEQSDDVQGRSMFDDSKPVRQISRFLQLSHTPSLTTTPVHPIYSNAMDFMIAPMDRMKWVVQVNYLSLNVGDLRTTLTRVV